MNRRGAPEGSSIEAEDLDLVRLRAGEGQDLTSWQAAELPLVSGLTFCDVVEIETVPDAFGAGGALLADDALEIVGHGARGEVLRGRPRC